jgi:hypothetical protein
MLDSCSVVLFGELTEQTERSVNKRLALLWQGWTRRLLEHLQQQAERYLVPQAKRV